MIKATYIIHFCAFFICIYRGTFVHKPLIFMEKKRLTKAEIELRKTLAKQLYTKDGVTTQKELAERVGISEKAIGKWIADENWKKERAGLMMTREEQLKRLYEQFTALNDEIAKRPIQSRYATPSEADTLVKLTKAIKQMETDIALSETIEALRNLINFVRPENLADAKVITKWSDLYIKTLVK